MAATLTQVGSAAVERRPSYKFVYLATLLFVLVYCIRPSDWVPGAASFPFAKIVGAVAIGAFLLSVLTYSKVKIFGYRETRLLLLLFLQMCLAIPFSVWRGGSFQLVILEFSKIVLIFLCILLSVTSVKRLRRLLFLQATSVALMCFLALGGAGSRLVNTAGERLDGVLGGVFANPNGFALSIAVVLPFAIAFLLESRNLVVKLFWLVCVFGMLGAVLETYSRGGFLATTVAVGVCLWLFAVCSPRYRWLLVLGFFGLLLTPILAPPGYLNRVSTILDPERDTTGSALARRDLLVRSLIITARNPIFGVGPGNFQIVSAEMSRDWHDAHNTFTRLSSEAGVPAFLFFALLLTSAISSTRKAIRLGASDPQVFLLGGALLASLLALVVGAMFADVPYHFFPYFLVGYAGALCQIVQNQASAAAESTEASASPLVETLANGRSASGWRAARWRAAANHRVKLGIEQAGHAKGK